MTEDRRTTDPFAPTTAAADPAAAGGEFPVVRLQRAGLDDATVGDLRGRWETWDQAARDDFRETVDGVDDTDLAADGQPGDVLGRFLDPDQQVGEAGDLPSDQDSGDYDPTAETVAEVEAHLRSVDDAGEVRRIADREKTAGDDRKGVAAAAEKRLAELDGQ